MNSFKSYRDNSDTFADLNPQRSGKESSEQVNCYVDVNYPNIGTCGNDMDSVRICMLRTRAIPDLIIQFDGERNGYVISGSFYNKDQTDLEIKEVAFISEDDLNEDRFLEN